MTLSRRDLPKLWLPLLAALLLFIVAGLLARGSQRDAGQAEDQRNAASAAKNRIELRLRQVRTEEQEIKDRSQILQQLQDSGITGEERRLDWMEMLRDLQRELRIPGMTYEFGAQTSLDNADRSADHSAHAWFSSPMRLQLRLLHEEDLLNFLARVQKDAPALVIVRGCKLSPLSRPADGREALAQLGAECEMQWLTVRRGTGK